MFSTDGFNYEFTVSPETHEVFLVISYKSGQDVVSTTISFDAEGLELFLFYGQKALGWVAEESGEDGED